jgi:hypothetical protein
MMVMMTAITPSLKASIRPLFIDAPSGNSVDPKLTRARNYCIRVGILGSVITGQFRARSSPLLPGQIETEAQIVLN